MTALALIFALGCGGASSNSTGAEGEGDGDQASDDEGDADAKPTRKPMERPVSDQGKSWGGWRWKGKREDCFYVHRNQCYATLDAACTAAKCKKSDCTHDEGAPAKVSCEK
jgi:hypothetical protein